MGFVAAVSISIVNDDQGGAVAGGGAAQTYFLLKEDSGFLLQETGDKFLLDMGPEARP